VKIRNRTRTNKLTPAVLALAALVIPAVPLALSADVRLPAVIGDHMIIQQGKPISLWGWAAPGETVTVRLAGKESKAKAGDDGRWRVAFDPLEAGAEPLELRVAGENGPEILLRDILVGEVWLCSGQSNMEWAMEWLTSPIPEILRADHPRLRLFQVPKRTSDRPLDDVAAKWTPCTSEAVRPFSAVAYYYGLALHEKLGVPVGLIESAWGGTDIEPWTPPAGFAAVPETQPLLDKQKAKYDEYKAALGKALPAWEIWLAQARKAIAAKGQLPPEPAGAFPVNPYESPQAPTTLYNGMIHPLTPLAIRGAIWYQGENNRNDGLFYEKKMEALILGWREVWGTDDFPFYYVQLAPYDYAYNRDMTGGVIPDFQRLPLVWEAQTNILCLPGTGMVVVTDITDLRDIHPRDKKDVGYRLSLWARAGTYGENGLVYSGPLYRSVTIEGDRARISFDHVGGGLMANDGRLLTWFEIAGDDHIFYKAQAEISGDTVVVWSSAVKAPAAVRFGWNQLAVPNLANREGLPASPFRTDDW